MGVDSGLNSQNKRQHWALSLLALSGLLWALPKAEAAPTAGSRKLVCDRIIDDFSGSKVGSFPKGWRTKNADEMPYAQANKVYSVVSDGQRKVLHAVFRGKAITLGKAISDWNLDAYPVLEWKWKAVKLPMGGNEDRMASNDCAASVYGFWDIGFPFYVDSLKYTWSSTLKVGTELQKRLGHDQVRVLQSGSAGLSRWHTVRVDVRADHARLFAREQARSPAGIALLTDADATESEAEAYYADFRLCRYQD